MIELVKELKSAMKRKQISPETAARFLGASGREVRRWLAEEAVPNFSSRKAIRTGLRRIRRVL